jgi:hypothetical protein
MQIKVPAGLQVGKEEAGSGHLKAVV